MIQIKYHRFVLLFTILVGLSLVLSACARGDAYPGAIAYQKVLNTDSQIFVMDPAGAVKTRVSTEGGWNFMPSWSADGETLAYYYFNPGTQMTLVYAVDVTQPELLPEMLTDRATFDTEFGPLKWSPTGEAILYYTLDSLANADIYKVNVVNGTASDIFEDAIYHDFTPDWSPDGSQFVFASNRPDKEIPIFDLYIADENGENLVQLTDNNNDGWVDTLPAWSPDGATIAFWRFNYIEGEDFEGGPEGVWILDLESQEESLLYEAEIPSGENPPVWSPDGKYLAFLEDINAEHTLRVIESASGELVDLSVVAGDKRAISWSPDSQALVFSNYSDPDAQMFILDIQSGELTEVLEADTGATIGDPHWGGN